MIGGTKQPFLEPVPAPERWTRLHRGHDRVTRHVRAGAEKPQPRPSPVTPTKRHFDLVIFLGKINRQRRARRAAGAQLHQIATAKLVRKKRLRRGGDRSLVENRPFRDVVGRPSFVRRHVRDGVREKLPDRLLLLMEQFIPRLLFVAGQGRHPLMKHGAILPGEIAAALEVDRERLRPDRQGVVNGFTALQCAPANQNAAENETAPRCPR